MADTITKITLVGTIVLLVQELRGKKVYIDASNFYLKISWSYRQLHWCN